MNIKSILIVLAAVVAGTLGGSVAYQVAVPAGNAQPATNESIVLKSPEAAARQQRRKARFAPCKAPAQLEGRRCVTDVVRTVSVPGSAAAASAPRQSAPAPSGSSGSSFNDDRRHGDDSGHDDGDDDADDGDDHSGPGGGGDDDSHTGTNTNTGTGTQTRTRTRSHD